LLFHSLVEFFSIFVGMGLFVVSVNTWRFHQNGYFGFIGSAYLFVGIIDLLHTLSYKGMGIFPDYGANLPTQLWISARALEVCSFLVAPIFFKRTFSWYGVLSFFSIVTALLLGSIYTGYFPNCFIEGQGLTPFKVYTEYIIILISCAVLIQLYLHKARFSSRVIQALAWAVVTTMMTELLFTLYINVFDFMNAFGHLLKMLSFYFIYRALVMTVLIDPVALLFRDLEKHRCSLAMAQKIAHLGYWTWHIEKDRVSESEELCQLLGRSLAQKQTLNQFLQVVHPEDQQRVTQAITTMLKQASMVFELEHRIVRGDGQVRMMLARGHVIYNHYNRAEQVIGTWHDISDRKVIEEKLRDAKIRAEHANQAKSEFLATMSHEIRTPLNGMLGFAQLLEVTELSEKQQHYLQTIRQSGDYLLHVINDILDFSKIEAQKMVLESIPFSLAELLLETTRLVQPQIDKKKLTFSYQIAPDVPLFLRGDPVRLRQILLNLLSNAAKFTAQGSITLQIDLKADQKAPVLLSFQVCDSGMGIASDQIEYLLKPFSQADSTTTRRFGGTGLGLAIVHKLGQLMGGGVSIDSVVGEGTTVTVTSRFEPLSQEAFLETISSQAAQDTLSLDREFLAERSVLVAEDDPINRMFIVETMRFLGVHHLILAENGREAFEAVQKGGIDLVLMDCQMGEMDGFEATECIRRWERKEGLEERLPVVALTANTFAEDRQRCLDAGMDDFLSKPLEIERLKRVLCRWFPSEDQLSLRCLAPLEEKKTASGAFDLQEMEVLQKIFGQEGLSALLQSFLKGLPQKIQAMLDAMAARDFEQLHQQAHILKGNCGMIKAKALFQVCQQCVDMGRANDLNALEPLRESLQQEAEQLTQALTAFLVTLEE
ncbi:MASE3 domain-containing protein, partial [Magnetococcales bacterium HHB-1]